MKIMIPLPKNHKCDIKTLFTHGFHYIRQRIKYGAWPWEIWDLGNTSFGEWLLPRLKYYRDYPGGAPAAHKGYKPHIFMPQEWRQIISRRNESGYPWPFFTLEEWEKIIDELIWWAERLANDDVEVFNDTKYDPEETNRRYERMRNCARLWAEYHKGIWN